MTENPIVFQTPDLTGFRAVITGASDGLGRAMTYALLRAGAKVGVAARAGEKLDGAISRMREDGFDPLPLPMDVRSEEDVRAAADFVEREWGGIDMLVNNAGVGMGTINPHFQEVDMPFYDIDVDAFRNMIETNLVGYFIVSKYFTPMMVRQNRGKIANVSTSLSTMTLPFMSPYGASRSGSETFTNTIRQELEPYNIDVNVILPGGITYTGLVPEESREKVLQIPTLLQPEIMEKPILFLASDESDGISGERFIGREFDDWYAEWKVGQN